MTKRRVYKYTDEQVIKRLNYHFAEAFEKLEQHKPGVIRCNLLDRDRLLDVCKFLKDQLNFRYPLSITALDWPENYELVYHLASYENKNLVEMHISLPKDDPEVMSVVRVWSGANFHEREAFDMIGIKFKTHPDLRRILLPEEVDYHPLRKDFPLGGEKATGGEDKLLRGKFIAR
jgi:NADH-quinone oxidoreductase subunit C